MSKTEKWVEIGKVSDVPVRGSRLIQVAGGAVAVFRTSDDSIFAIDDRCPHLGGPLSQGIVHDQRVTCPLHNLIIDLASGEGLGPDGGCVRTYPTDVQGDRILLDVSALKQKKVA
ncbi:nitrite reductase small subunit NirD [Parvibaculaceae bacterium PLY_AMNH_Bact1]|nr:nitrite reductase small subunit NirD [Parvibaculaceae bacterium PLY_AMNH_Bact1]